MRPTTEYQQKQQANKMNKHTHTKSKREKREGSENRQKAAGINSRGVANGGPGHPTRG